MRALALLLLAAPTVAAAYESPDQPVVFSDEVDVWSAVEFDTGDLPSGSPVTLRFFIASDGGAFTDIDSASQMEWPDPLAQSWASYADGGYLALVTDLSLNLEIAWDIFGVTGREPLWNEGLFFEDGTYFDGLLLPQGTPETASVTAAGGSLQNFNFSQSIVTGVEVGFNMDLIPAAAADLEGVRIDNTDGQALISTDVEGDVSYFDVPVSHPGYIELLATYYGSLHAVLSLVLTPAVEVCVVGQCFEVASFDIPIDLIDTTQGRTFRPVSVHHPLPSMVEPNPSHDFGEVLVGNTFNFELPFENRGEMYLEGWVEVVGSDNITVFPDYFYAQPGQTDGVVVSFLPDAPIEETALLRITSNDPLHPEIEIPLRGVGTEPEPDPGESPDGYVYEGRSIGLSGCGCNQSAPMPGWLALAGLTLLVRRRRA